MTGGENVKHTDLFYARVYTFRKTYHYGAKARVLGACAGTFIYLDLVLTALQCVQFDSGYWVDKTVIQHGDFNKPQTGLIENSILDVLLIHPNPQFAKNKHFLDETPTNGVALLEIKPSSSFWSPRFMPLPPCHEKTIRAGYQLKMLGMTKSEGQFSIKDPIKADEFLFNSEFVQEAQFREVDPSQLFERVYNTKNFFIKWKDQTPKIQRNFSHRIVAFSEQGAKMDGDKGALGSPAFLSNDESKMPVCLYGVLTGFIFDVIDVAEGAPKNAETVTAVDLDGVFFHHEWLKEQIDKSKKRWEEFLDPEKVKKTREIIALHASREKSRHN